MKKAFKSLIIFTLILGLNGPGLMAIEDTLAFFSDTETTTGTFQAGTLDLDLEADDNFSTPTAGESNELTKNATVTNAGSLDFQYDITTNNVDNCSEYEIKGENQSTDDVCATSSVADFECAAVSLSAGNSHNWKFELFKSEDCDSTCKFDLEFDAWQTNLSKNQGFTDNETINNEVVDPASSKESPVVLNEFLPNPDEFQYEYIELYNKSSEEKYDLADYYIMVNKNKRIDFATDTLEQYAKGSSVIEPEGWLAITTPTNEDLGNASGTIALYNPEGKIIDEISYPLDGDATNDVPEDKSIARIPDGTGGWVDPVPTPGEANVKEEIEEDADKEETTNNNSTSSAELATNSTSTATTTATSTNASSTDSAATNASSSSSTDPTLEDNASSSNSVASSTDAASTTDSVASSSEATSSLNSSSTSGAISTSTEEIASSTVTSTTTSVEDASSTEMSSDDSTSAEEDNENDESDKEQSGDQDDNKDDEESDELDDSDSDESDEDEEEGDDTDEGDNGSENSDGDEENEESDTADGDVDDEQEENDDREDSDSDSQTGSEE